MTSRINDLVRYLLDSARRALWAVFFMLSPRAKLKLKKLLQGDGHKRSVFSSLIATRNADGKERFDRAFRVLAEDLQWLASDDKIGSALEVGVGYVATSLLSLRAMTGARVEGVDINRLLDLKATLRATSKMPVLYEMDSELRDPNFTANCLEGLSKIASVSGLRAWMQSNDIHYRAPASLETVGSAISRNHDLVYSRSVLEHIAPSNFNHFVHHLKRLTSDGGHNIHFIDLTDHISHHEHPQLFRDDESYDAERDSGWRGNAMLPSQILDCFQKNFEVVYFTSGHSLEDQRIRSKRLLKNNQNLDDLDRESQWILVHVINE